jgi:hypothetical protein
MAKAKSGGLIAPQEAKEEFSFNQRVEIDGISSDMQCKLTFDQTKGNIKITACLTTKQLSFDEQGKTIALSLCALQMKSAYEKGLELKREFLEAKSNYEKGPELKREFLEAKSNYDPDQGELPFGGSDDDDGAFVTFGLPGSAETD